MAKTPISTRVEPQMYEALNKIGDILTLSEHDVYRMAFAEYIEKRLPLIKEYDSTYRPSSTEQNKWSRVDADKYVMWEWNRTWQVEVSVLEVFSDNTIRISKAVLPSSFETIKEKINEFADFKINENGIVVVNVMNEVIEENKVNSERIILSEYATHEGKVIKEERFKTDNRKKEILQQYEVY